MIKQENVDQLAEHVKKCQLVYMALISGVLMFAAMTIFLSWGKINHSLSITTIIGLVISIPSIVFSVIGPKIVCMGAAKIAAQKAVKDKKSPDDQSVIIQCANHYLTNRIVRGAALEGGIFVNLVFFMLEHSSISLAAAAALIAFMSVGFPSTGKAVEFLDGQVDRVRQEVQLLS